MRIPTIIEAEKIFKVAEQMNSGICVQHNQVAGNIARAIAKRCKDMDEEVAYILGLLHDIGRRFGTFDMKHILYGYSFMNDLGYEDSAKICLTHSFPLKNINSYNGKNDCTEEESQFIQSYIDDLQYDDYDRLIQLCDAISFHFGVEILEKKFVDVVMKRGFNEFTILKWKELFKIKVIFDEKTNGDIYKLVELIN